ncbi:MAG: site-specific recombinase [Bdellovibrionaceae bacterium]|nr:site-specific recombinase [Pseudobdellovibrionaceae bacterium]NUM57371.1 hypothetical protein [Pseudobdellovibrionaceae bacterium]
MIHIDTLLNQNLENKVYAEQVKWLLSIFEWIRMPKDIQNHNIPLMRIYSVRTRYLLNILEKNPQWKSHFITSISSILKQMSSVGLFTEVGLSLNTSFIQEFIRRIEEKFLPQAPLVDNLTSLLFELFPDENESILIDTIDEPVFNEFVDLFFYNSELKEILFENMVTSLQILSVQFLANTYTIHREIYENVQNHERWPESLLVFNFAKNVTENPSYIEYFLSQSEENLNLAYSVMETKGIKIDLVFLIESQKRRLERMTTLFKILNIELASRIAIRRFISQLILDIHHQKSLRSFFGENLSLITKQIIRKNSDLGEHYVTFNWFDFIKMYRAAVGGGAFTAITVYIKFFLSTFVLSGFLKGLSEGLNYALSFLSIQALGWTLATKQPSTTAPYLAESLQKSLSTAKSSILAIIRTQFISVLGNLTLIVPICFFISLGAKKFGYELFTENKAQEIFYSSNFFGPSFIFAFFTGFLLFFSSIIAGWFDNWVTLHKLPERIKNHQGLINVLGLNKASKVSEIIAKNANPMAANISLGFLLGFMPQYLKFFGIPLEVRHVTLASGNFAACLPFLNSTFLGWQELTNSITGLLLIGVINISVSFTFALGLASISSQISLKRLWSILTWGLHLVLTKPWLLVIPPKENNSPLKQSTSGKS